LSQHDPRRLIDQQMNVLGHQHIRVNPRPMPRARLLQHSLARLPGDGRFKQRKTMKATESDEVQRFRLLESSQSARHEHMLAHNARSSRYSRDERGTVSSRCMNFFCGP
jgi:hypothetical protein